MRRLSAGDLRNRIDVYGKTQVENELGEKDYAYSKLSSIWAKITPVGGIIKNGEANTTYADITHEIVIRDNAISNLANDMYFIYSEQRYNIKYFNPNYEYRDSIKIFCSLVVE